MHEALFTVGHSTHALDYFIALLKKHAVTAVCDVRSKPYSRTNPQFNREQLKRCLREAKIAYVFLGNELGGRSEDLSYYVQGKVQYERLAEKDLFRKGLDRVREGMRKYRIALMCAEREPLECHRTILVARHLESLGVNVQHIHADGRLESHASAMERLVRQLNLPEQDMFRSHGDIVADAYRLQETRIAHGRSDAGDEEAPSVRSAAG